MLLGLNTTSLRAAGRGYYIGVGATQNRFGDSLVKKKSDRVDDYNKSRKNFELEAGKRINYNNVFFDFNFSIYGKRRGVENVIASETYTENTYSRKTDTGEDVVTFVNEGIGHFNSEILNLLNLRLLAGYKLSSGISLFAGGGLTVYGYYIYEFVGGNLAVAVENESIGITKVKPYRLERRYSNEVVAPTLSAGISYNYEDKYEAALIFDTAKPKVHAGKFGDVRIKNMNIELTLRRYF